MAFVYSCCFWFSLRLGGILIGLFSLLQGVLLLAALSIGYMNMDSVQEKLSAWMKQTDLSFSKKYFDSIRDGIESYITVGIVLTSIYLILCLTFIYGAFKCSNTLMLGFLVVEISRLVFASVLVIVWLMVLKRNTMDIGQLIGASVAGGFAMLGMFYLWVCAANLPVLINEMEREEQQKTIDYLQRVLDQQRSQKRNYNHDMDELLPAFPAVDPAIPDIYKHSRKNFLATKMSEGGKSGAKSVRTISSLLPERNGFRVPPRDYLH